MSEYEQSVFISYAWGTEREDIVNEIDETLQQRGIRIVRDKRALGYRGSIRDFMERIGRGSCVIVVISDKYLRSPNCMFELVEIADNKQFHDRVFPVILTDANIYDPLKRIEYIKFWEGKRKELAKAMKTLDPANLQGIREEMDQYDRIRDKISGITSILKDMNTLTPEMHRDSEFSNLYDAIVERLKEGATDVTTEFDEMAKKAEAERKAKEEADRIARAEANRLAARKAEEERLAIVKAEEERKAKEEADHLAAQKAEEERLAKVEADRLAAQKAEEERIERARAERERLALARAEEERKAREEADRLAAQKAEKERMERERAEQERLAQAKADREAKAEAARLAAQKAEEERLAKVEAERRAKEDAARLAAQKAEAERQAKQRAEEERLAKAKADREAKEKVVPAPAMPVEMTAEGVSAAPTQKKPASNVMMYGIGAVVLLVVLGIGFSVLNSGNKNAPVSTPTNQAAVVVPATVAPTLVPVESPTLVAAPIGGSTGKIVFASNGGIYIMNADGSGVTRLADGDYPVWSPDGKKIAFSDGTIKLMNADGSDKTRLNRFGFGRDPVWSPDGKQLAYNCDANICIINADDSNPYQLTKLQEAHIYFLSWSPGKNIVFTVLEGAGGATNIYSINADGSNLRRIAGAHNIYIQRPVWSPDGKYVTFESDRDGYQNIYIMNADGSGQTQLTENSGANASPAWSPDGKKIVFASNRDQPDNPPAHCLMESRPCVMEIYIMNADGSNQTRLTNNTAVDYDPVWSPDGKYIAFVSSRDENSEIYIMNADGSGVTRLTDNAADDYSPVWQP